jgi:hypothetical protein
MAEIVNLDALIPREDFEIAEAQDQAQAMQTIQIRDLEKDSFFYSVIRKPDFQRETNEWGIGKITDFVQSFLDGDLIPAIILWRGGANIFVIDGAHRLSALIAWVQDDCGDGLVSKLFYSGALPEEQVRAAERTRKFLKKAIGSYQDHKNAIQHPDQFASETVARARRLASLALQLQWVTGDATKAEASFFKINQQAAPIDKTELRLLQSRNKPNALAARAIIRAGTGHKYWSRFTENVKAEIEQQAKEINELLFTPALKTPIKTLDLPVAGRGYSSQTLPLVFELVNITNHAPSENPPDDKDDKDGKTTIEHLKNCHRILNRISGTHPSSLGMHPAVYFYSNTGRYQPTTFFGIVEFIKELEKKNAFKSFISVRKEFEAFLLKYKMLPNQVTLKYGSGLKGYQPMAEFFSTILRSCLDGKSQEETIAALISQPRFSYLQAQEMDENGDVSAAFNTAAKSAAFLRDALKEPLRCGICGGLIHFNSISIDHIKRREDGGLGAVDNAQLSHPFCNTTVKN